MNQLKDKTFKGIAKEAYFSNVLHNIPFVQKTLSQWQHFEESIFGSFVQRTLISLTDIKTISHQSHNLRSTI